MCLSEEYYQFCESSHAEVVAARPFDIFWQGKPILNPVLVFPEYVLPSSLGLCL